MERSSIDDYIVECAQSLGLQDWEIIYKPDETVSDSAEADIRPQFGKVAFLRLSNEFWNGDASYQRTVICHELLHLHCSAIDDLVTNLDKVLGTAMHSFFQSSYDDQIDHLIENLSKLLAPILPLRELVRNV